MVLQKRQWIMLAIITVILITPLIAMQFTSEVNWNLPDFIVAAALLVTTALGIDVVLRSVQLKPYRLLLCALIVCLLLLVWAELAVGILGTPISGS